jgi:hypothetical protein
MNRLSMALALLVTALPMSGAHAGTLPPKIEYTIYMNGERVGHTTIRTSETADAIVLESNLEAHFSSFDMNLTCRTEADKKTFLVRNFEYQGTKGGMDFKGVFDAVGDSLHFTVTTDSVTKDDYRIAPDERNLVIEDYVFEHQALLALAVLRSGERIQDYGLVFPSAVALTTCTVGDASKASLESDTAELICTKIVVAISGSDPYASYYDPTRHVPVYIAFPQTNVEVFLDEFFGKTPVSNYR